MKSQNGMATLLVTVMLLVVALLFSMASYKNVFYQIKRTQNEVLSRQAHWAAEGGLECGFSAIKNAGSISAATPTFSNCESDLELVDIDVDLNNNIVSKYAKLAKKTLKKKITFSPTSYGAIQTRSQLKLLGGITIAPDIIDHLDGNKYQCVSVRYSSNVIVTGAVQINPPGGALALPEFSYPNVVSSPQCGSDYSTSSGSGFDTAVTPPSSTGPVKKDFEHEPTLDPFEGFFGKNRSEIASIKTEYEQITGSIKGSTDIDRCAKRINNAFGRSNKVWVTGDCDLHGDSLGTLGTAKVIVFHNGIVGASGSVTYDGSVYHLIDDPTFFANSLIPRWGNMDSSFYSSYLDTNSVFFANGSFVPTGGIIFDTPGGVTTYRVGLNLTYNRGYNPNPPSLNVNWQQGSWHDF